MRSSCQQSGIEGRGTADVRCHPPSTSNVDTSLLRALLQHVSPPGAPAARPGGACHTPGFGALCAMQGCFAFPLAAIPPSCVQTLPGRHALAPVAGRRHWRPCARKGALTPQYKPLANRPVRCWAAYARDELGSACPDVTVTLWQAHPRELHRCHRGPRRRRRSARAPAGTAPTSASGRRRAGRAGRPPAAAPTPPP